MPDTLERLKAALADRYRIERELGGGGMATVYLARDLKHERQVAVKVLRPELAAALGPERFHQEIKIAANLTHPHILPLHDSGDADGFLYYVMPYVEGESLRDKLAREGELPIAETVRILRDTVDALGHAHKHGVVHRDIKPDNVLLSERHALVTDFGVAKAVSEATGAHKLTTEGVALGTPAYMSPEQAAADKHIDDRADIYAVGVLAYEVLTGRPPFTGTTPQEVLSAQVTQAPDPVTKYRATVPPALAQVVMKCLEKKAADRWQSADELLPQLEALATPSGGITPTGTMPVDRAVRRRWMMAGGAVAMAAMIAVIVVIAALPRGSGRVLDPHRILVVALADESGLEETQALGRMAQAYIIDILSDAGFAKVVDPLTTVVVSQNVTDAGRAPADILALADEARAGTVVSGDYYLEGDSIHVQTRITDANDGSLMRTVGPIIGSIGARSELVARLGQEVVAALAALLDQDTGFWEPAVRPATYEAYEAYSQGVDAYLRAEGLDAAGHFERAAAADPTFYRAALWAAQTHSLLSYWNAVPDLGSYAKAESLITPLLESRSQLSRYENCRLDLVMAIGIRPSLSAAYDAARCMAREAPGSDDAKREVAILSYRINRPREAITLLRQFDPDRGLMKHEEYWVWLCRAYHTLGDYNGELEASRQWQQRFPESLRALQSEAWALAALGRLDDVAAMLAAMRSLASQEGLENSLLAVAAELRAHGHRDVADDVINEVIAWVQSRPLDTERSRVALASGLYLAERWDDALQLYQELAEEYPENTAHLAALGRLAARRGDRAEALRISEELRSYRHPLLVRDHTMQRARIAAVFGERERAVTLLRQAHEQLADWADVVILHRNIDFETLRDYPPFQELLRPKG